MSPVGHGYSRVPMGDGSFALLDTFGKPETTPTHVCEAWDSGQSKDEMAAVAAGSAVVILFAKGAADQ